MMRYGPRSRDSATFFTDPHAQVEACMNNDEKTEMELEFFLVHKMYTEYFSALDTRGIASFIGNSEAVLGGFETSLENFEKEKRLFAVRRRAIVTALLEHPAAQHLKGDMSVLAKLAGIDLLQKDPIRH